MADYFKIWGYVRYREGAGGLEAVNLLGVRLVNLGDLD